MTSGADEIEAGVDSQINLIRSPRLLFLKHVALMLVVQEFNDRLPAITIVHVVAEARSINDRQADLEKLLFQFSLGDFDLDGLVDLLGVTSAMVGIVFDGSAEEGVDEGGLAETGFAGDHDCEGGATFGDDFVTLVWELSK